jgi:hypothetical protein
MIGDRAVYAADVTTGKNGYETATGHWQIIERVFNEEMRSDQIGSTTTGTLPNDSGTGLARPTNSESTIALYLLQFLQRDVQGPSVGELLGIERHGFTLQQEDSSAPPSRGQRRAGDARDSEANQPSSAA